MFCSKCGANIPDYSLTCPHCGAAIQQSSAQHTAPTYQQPTQQGTYQQSAYQQGAYQQNAYQQPYQQPVYTPSYGQGQTVPRNDTLAICIKVFLVLGCAAGATACLLPLAWCLPMTISIWKSLDNRQPISTAMKVCTLLFVNLIAGVLLLCDNESN